MIQLLARRSILAAALVASTSIATSALAAPVGTVSTPALDSNSWAGPTTLELLSGVTYQLALSWSSITGSYAASNFSALVYQGANFVWNISNVGSVDGGGAGTSTTFSVATSGTYQLWLNAAGVSAGGPVSGSYTVHDAVGSVTAVPGPVAAAGLPAALAALVGFGLYRRRRNPV